MLFDIEVEYQDHSLGLHLGRYTIDRESLDDAARILAGLTPSTKPGCRERFAAALSNLDVGEKFSGPVKPQAGEWFRVRRIS